jgi:hypothetical protein
MNAEESVNHKKQRIRTPPITYTKATIVALGTSG